MANCIHMSCTGHATCRLDDAYRRGQEVMRERAADLVVALPKECTVTDYNYRNGWRDACSYAEMRIRALEVKP